MSSEDKHKTGMILPVIVNWPNKIDWDSMGYPYSSMGY